MLEYENKLYDKGYKLICGIDEVGRGPLLGPVVTSAVILPVGYYNPEIKDSKKLSEKKREKLFDIITKDAVSIGIGIVDEKKIDEINIYEATKVAMKMAIDNLSIKPDYVLIDAMKLDIDIPSNSIIKGDAKSITIAAASVLAKVTRDHIMDEYDKMYPEYEFALHKGYPTKKHLEKMNIYGILDIYRTTYKPVKDCMERKKNEVTQK